MPRTTASSDPAARARHPAPRRPGQDRRRRLRAGQPAPDLQRERRGRRDRRDRRRPEADRAAVAAELVATVEAWGQEFRATRITLADVLPRDVAEGLGYATTEVRSTKALELLDADPVLTSPWDGPAVPLGTPTWRCRCATSQSLGRSRAWPGSRPCPSPVPGSPRALGSATPTTPRYLYDAEDIADELTRRRIVRSLGGSAYEPTDPVGRLVCVKRIGGRPSW
ncbi:hypothetical protein NKG05_06130 [Oerskovia sp. M15]